MSNPANTKITRKDLCDLTLNWLSENVANLNPSWSIDNLAPATCVVDYHLYVGHGAGYQKDNYKRVNSYLYQTVSIETVKSQLLTYLQTVVDSSFSLTDTTTVLNADDISQLEDALTGFVFVKVVTCMFDGTFYELTSAKVFLYDINSNPSTTPMAGSLTPNLLNTVKADTVSNLVKNFTVNLAYNNVHKTVQYQFGSHSSSSCCSSSSCSSSSSRFLAHIQ